MSVMSLLPLLVAFVAMQALLVVKVADRITDGATPSDSRGHYQTAGGRYFGVA